MKDSVVLRKILMLESSLMLEGTTYTRGKAASTYQGKQEVRKIKTKIWNITKAKAGG